MVRYLYKTFQYLEMDKGGYVFEYGDRGQRFYIILSGCVEIIVPEGIKLMKNESEPDGILDFVIQNHDSIYWEGIQGGIRMREKFYQEVKDVGTPFKEEDRTFDK